uniref:Uncharacterized protein n=1 Tax=Oryza barthii TaxID=65489 RepID=A0A0D3HMK1_9ORYZ
MTVSGYGSYICMDQEEHVICGIEDARRLVGLPPPIHITMTECLVKDAGEVLKLLDENITSGRWTVSDETVALLRVLAEGCEDLMYAKKELTDTVKAAQDDLITLGGNTLSVEERLLLQEKEDRRILVLRALNLPPDSKPSRSFDVENIDAVLAARGRLRGQIVQARADMEGLRQYITETWLPWVEQRLNTHLTLGEPVMP